MSRLNEPKEHKRERGWTARECADAGSLAWFNAQQRRATAGRPSALAAALSEALAEISLSTRVGGADGQ